MEAMFRKYCDKYSIQLPENIPLSSPKFKATKEQVKRCLAKQGGGRER